MTADRPNLVLVTVDSLRADHCGCYGYPNDTTPHLDALAADGVVYEHAVAPAPYTERSMPATFGGDYPVGDAAGFERRREAVRAHAARRTFLPERLRERGYHTIGFSPNPYTSRHFGFDAGFDRFEDFLGGDGPLRTALARAATGDPVEALRLAANAAGLDVPGFGNQSIPVRAYYDAVLDEVAAAPEPFFCWVFLLEVHSPYRPARRFRPTSLPRMLSLNLARSALVDRDPTPAEAAGLRALYDGAVRTADAAVGRLLRDLGARNPVVAVHADHGEAFGEHGTYGHHGHLYEENVRVPLVVSGPGVDAERVADPVSLRALPGLLSDVADGPADVDWAAYAGEAALSRIGPDRVCVRGRDWKHVDTPDGERGYDLAADPGERRARDGCAAGRRAVERHRADRRERRRIADAAADIAREVAGRA